MFRLLSFCALTLSLTACGTIYKSPSVTRATTGSNQDLKIRIIPMTEQSTRVANMAPFTPQRLPAVFSQVAGMPKASAQSVLPSPTQAVNVPFPSQEVFLPDNPRPTPYVIGISDVVLVSAPTVGSSVEQLSGLLASQNKRQGYTVQDDGTIAIPDVGRIEVGGLTLKEAESKLFQALVAKNFEPSFSLEIAEFNSQRVSIGGAVAKPTVAPISLKSLDLKEAIQLAGGIPQSDLDFVTVRLYRDGVLYQVPASKLFDQRKSTTLVDGDSVFVDTEFELDKAQTYFKERIALAQARGQERSRAIAEMQTAFQIRSQQLATKQANFEKRLTLGAVKRDYVYLFGEVKNQSRLPFPFEQTLTLADALFGAGGVSMKEADISQIYVLRRSSDPREFGARTAYHLDARSAGEVLTATFFEMRPNDIVFVSEQPVTSWNRVISQITPSLLTSTIGAVAN